MKITRQKLSRGTKLTVEHYNDPMTAIASNISTGNIAAEQLDRNTGKFNMCWNMPSIESYMFDEIAGLLPSVIMIPFVLPPTQDKWNSDLSPSADTPFAKLTSLSIGFDQMRTNDGILDQWNTNPTTSQAGDNKNDMGSNYDIELSIKEKPTERATGDILTHIPGRTVWSQNISGLGAYGGDTFRLNPTIVEGIDEIMRPYHTYVIYIKFPNIVAPTDTNGITWRLGAPSFTLNANFEYALMARDTYDTGNNLAVQNIPSLHDGNKSTSAIAFDVPLSDSIITATAGSAGNGRIQTNLVKLDDRIIAGIKGGYNQTSEIHVSEELSEDSTYCVIAVPMFGQIGDVRASDLNLTGLAYAPPNIDYAGEVYPGIIRDSRTIPLPYPMVIHHVIAVHNYMSPATLTDIKPRRNTAFGEIPVSSTYKSAIGLACINGNKSEDKNMQQIAYLEQTVANKALWVIDRIKQGGLPPYYGVGTAAAGQVDASPYDIEMFHVPLVWNTSRVNFSYRDTGAPFFVGQGNMATRARRECGVLPDSFGGGALTNPTTGGGEQSLEVVWEISDSAGLSTGNPEVTDNTVYVGNGGCFVYIIGKRALIK